MKRRSLFVCLFVFLFFFLVFFCFLVSFLRVVAAYKPKIKLMRLSTCYDI